MNPAMPETADVFNDVAAFYDKYFSPTLNVTILPAVESLLLTHLEPGDRILDVCCGNGHMVRSLRDKGFAADGTDAAEEMLRYARQYSPEAVFTVQDALNLKVTRPYKAMTAFGYAINHCCMNSKDLLKMLKAMHRALEPKGYLLFDLIMEAGIEESSLRSFEIRGHDHVLSSQGEYLGDRKMARVMVAMEGLASSETMANERQISFYQRCFSEDAIRQTLKKAGFTDIIMADGRKDLNLDPQAGPRLFVSARKA